MIPNKRAQKPNWRFSNCKQGHESETHCNPSPQLVLNDQHSREEFEECSHQVTRLIKQKYAKTHKVAVEISLLLI